MFIVIVMNCVRGVTASCQKAQQVFQNYNTEQNWVERAKNVYSTRCSLCDETYDTKSEESNRLNKSLYFGAV